MFEIFASLDPYCKPTSDLIEGNEARLVAQYNHTTPIVKLFRRFEECRDIAVANNTAFTTNQLLQKFITLMEKTKVYDTKSQSGTTNPLHTKRGPTSNFFGSRNTLNVRIGHPQQWARPSKATLLQIWRMENSLITRVRPWMMIFHPSHRVSPL